MFLQKLMKKRAGILDVVRILIAYADIHSRLALGKEPAVAGRHHPVEGHLNMVRFKWNVLPPTHDRLHQTPGSLIDSKPGVGTIRNHRIPGRYGFGIATHKADYPVTFKRQCLSVKFREKPNT